MILLHSASQIVTPLSFGKFLVLDDGAIGFEGGTISFIGSTADGFSSFPNAEKINVSGKVLTPGFVDAHTHLVFAGDRTHEFLTF